MPHSMETHLEVNTLTDCCAAKTIAAIAVLQCVPAALSADYTTHPNQSDDPCDPIHRVGLSSDCSIRAILAVAGSIIRVAMMTTDCYANPNMLTTLNVSPIRVCCVWCCDTAAMFPEMKMSLSLRVIRKTDYVKDLKRENKEGFD